MIQYNVVVRNTRMNAILRLICFRILAIHYPAGQFEPNQPIIEKMFVPPVTTTERN